MISSSDELGEELRNDVPLQVAKLRSATAEYRAERERRVGLVDSPERNNGFPMVVPVMGWKGIDFENVSFEACTALNLEYGHSQRFVLPCEDKFYYAYASDGVIDTFKMELPETRVDFPGFVKCGWFVVSVFDDIDKRYIDSRQFYSGFVIKPRDEPFETEGELGSDSY